MYHDSDYHIERLILSHKDANIVGCSLSTVKRRRHRISKGPDGYDGYIVDFLSQFDLKYGSDYEIELDATYFLENIYILTFKTEETITVFKLADLFDKTIPIHIPRDKNADTD